MILEKGPKVQCKKCSQLFFLDVNEFDGPEINIDERNMGYETQYIWEYIGECNNCNNEISVIIEGWEYPQGVFNYDEFNSRGCKIVEKPLLKIHFEDDTLD